MLLERVDAMLIAGMVRQKLRHIPHVGILKILEEPHQPPRVVSRRGANIGAGQVRSRLIFARVAEGMELAEQGDRQQLQR